MLENVIGEDNNVNISENIVTENNNDNSDDLMNIASFFNIQFKLFVCLYYTIIFQCLQDLNNCLMSISGLEGYEYPIDQIQPLLDLLKK